MLEKVGWTPTPLETERQAEGTFGGGVLTHGGSLANLTALIAARSALRPEAWREGTLTSVGFFMSHLRALVMIRCQGTWAGRARVPGNRGR
jgi:glutamate/tyrosine decarboxylase-like PLP-dependent enzyme